MITLEESLTSFKFSRKLRHAGAKQDSREWWCEEADEGHKLYTSSIANTRMASLPDLEQWSAFDCHELWERLKVVCPIRVEISSDGALWILTCVGNRDIPMMSAGEFVEALGNLYLFCLENGYIKEDVK